MDAKLLQPAVQDLFDYFGGKYRAKIEMSLQIQPDGKIDSSAYAFLGPIEDVQVFFGPTCEQAIEKAKLTFKPLDPAWKSAAEKLRQQAKLIESGDAPIPESCRHEYSESSTVCTKCGE